MHFFAEFIAGFAFFLVGLKLFSVNLNQLTSKRFRTLITKYTSNDVMAGFSGVLLSLLTAGNTVLTPCIAAGFETVKAINFRKAIQIVLWSRVGACLFIYLAGLDIHIFILFLLGMAGISFASNKPKGYSTFASSAFDLGLVLFGITTIKHSTKVLLEFDWFSQIVEYTQLYPEISFLAGIVFILCSQSLFGAMVIAVSFIDSGVFNIEQAVLFSYGVYLGEAILKIFYLTAFKGIFKKVMSLLPAIYLFVFFVAFLDYILENYVGIPLIQAAAHAISSSPKQELAHINFGVHFVAVLLMSINVGRMEAFIHKVVGVVEEDELEVFEVPEELLDDSEITMSLITKEELRLIKSFPKYMENVRSGVGLQDPLFHKSLHEYLHLNLQAIRNTYSGLLGRSRYHKKVSGQLLDGIEKQNLLMALEDNLFHFSTSIDLLRSMSKDDPEFSSKFLNFVEAMDATLLTLGDVMEDPSEKFNLSILKQITEGKEDFMKEIRDQYSSHLAILGRVELIKVVNLFESSVWVIHKITNVAVENHVKKAK
ncbi:MAG: phosphate:Na+ symporter [Chlamydiales bacterium]|jgi:phosphate:Na+ symporter